MSSDYAFRLATPHDAEILSAIATRTFRNFVNTTLEGDVPPEDLAAYLARMYSVEKMQVELEDPTRITGFVFPKDDHVKPCGFFMMIDCSIRPGDEDKAQAEDHLEIRRVYVDTAFHGKGAAYVLMDHVVELAKARNRKLIWLMAARRNLRAKKFYGKYGFEAMGDYGLAIGTAVIPYEVFTL